MTNGQGKSCCFSPSLFQCKGLYVEDMSLGISNVFTKMVWWGKPLKEEHFRWPSLYQDTTLSGSYFWDFSSGSRLRIIEIIIIIQIWDQRNIIINVKVHTVYISHTVSLVRLQLMIFYLQIHFSINRSIIWSTKCEGEGEKKCP